MENVLADLLKFSESSSTPADFEYLMAKAFCIIFQLPIFVSYGLDFNVDSEPSVVWRGKISAGDVPEGFAPGGAQIRLCTSGEEDTFLAKQHLDQLGRNGRRRLNQYSLIWGY